MSEKKTEDHVLDELLNSMPQFTDKRSKDEIYQKVKSEIETQEKLEKRNRVGAAVNKWLPFIISVASVLILTVLVSSYISDNSNSTADKAIESSMAEDRMTSTEETEEASMKVVEEEKSNDMTIFSSPENATFELVPFDSSFTSVYDSDINGGTVFHFSMIENALSVPITIVIPKEQIDLDFPDGAPNSLELYERYAFKIDETALGFQEYHPYKGYFLAEGNMLKHYLPADHGYDTAPGTAAPYISSINETFTDFDSLARVNEDGSPIEWDQVGTLTEPLALQGIENNANYFAYKAFNEETYLTPNFNKTFDTLEAALLDMKNPENDIYTSVIPNGMNFTVRDDKGFIVHFDEPLNLESLGASEASRLIEGFSLTAASFNQSIKLENVVQEKWQGIDLTKSLPIPIGPNGFNMMK
ncbi:hypothetical protein SAMN05518871_10319 [Psychrobacillus sp. OK028]|uniref:hypothetical protein n=1 Tax=Psychrobacillus sp. OK028 TaxID=1884359 RepID=UPI00088DB970|nr:hypothetical protein [Psychrobacillus sp. OK028]SDN00240.1 hypothetical protein SAMN05518871_10319 [Psychrobacillus sp. OK028]